MTVTDMHSAEHVAAFARRHLKGILNVSGEVLYSAAATIRRGDVYLIGHNPGGSHTNADLPKIGASLKGLPRRTTNSYLQQWDGRPAGEAPLQRRVIWLLNQLGFDPRRVAASNLIFPRSRAAAGSQFQMYSRLCWPVHEQILRIVRPRLLLVYGNGAESPYGFLHDRFDPESDESYPSGHGTWVCRTFVVPDRFRVVGIPHMSRYDVSAHIKVVKWIKGLHRP